MCIISFFSIFFFSSQTCYLYNINNTLYLCSGNVMIFLACVAQQTTKMLTNSQLPIAQVPTINFGPFYNQFGIHQKPNCYLYNTNLLPCHYQYIPFLLPICGFFHTRKKQNVYHLLSFSFLLIKYKQAEL